MTIHLKLDLNSVSELEAFGVFCTSVAAARRAEPPRPSVRDLLYGGFGIGKASNPMWQAKTYAPESELPEEAQDAKVETAPLTAAANPAGAFSADAPKPTRERGQPSPGKARRTKAEIAEDEAAAKAPDEYLTGIVAKTAGEDPVAAISTGEERVGPEDDAETQAADAADEAAETAAAKTDGKLTHDDLRNVIGIYVKAFGLGAATDDMKVVLGEVTAGAVKVTDIPDDKIGEAIAAVKAAGKANRFARTAVTE